MPTSNNRVPSTESPDIVSDHPQLEHRGTYIYPIAAEGSLGDLVEITNTSYEQKIVDTLPLFPDHALPIDANAIDEKLYDSLRYNTPEERLVFQDEVVADPNKSFTGGIEPLYTMALNTAGRHSEYQCTSQYPMTSLWYHLGEECATTQQYITHSEELFSCPDSPPPPQAHVMAESPNDNNPNDHNNRNDLNDMIINYNLIINMNNLNNLNNMIDLNNMNNRNNMIDLNNMIDRNDMNNMNDNLILPPISI